MERRWLLNTFNGDVKWCSHYGKQYGSAKNTNREATIQANKTVPRFTFKENEPVSK